MYITNQHVCSRKGGAVFQGQFGFATRDAHDGGWRDPMKLPMVKGTIGSSTPRVVAR